MPNKILLAATTTAQWKQLLEHAEQRCQYPLDEELESYLIFTLIRFTQNTELASQLIAPDYLSCADLPHKARQHKLRDIGDQCLLLSGLFPQRAEKRRLRTRYYVDLGRSAYQNLSEILSQSIARLYQLLAIHFVPIMDVLQNIRGEPALQPLQALDLWQDTGSRNACRILKQETRGGMIILNNETRH